MSYDMQIGDEDFNYTYNVSNMWYAALPEKGICTHYGMTGAQAEVPLLLIYNYMVMHRKELEKFNPSNGWGDYYGALKFVHNLIAASLRNQNEVWSGS